MTRQSDPSTSCITSGLAFSDVHSDHVDEVVSQSQREFPEYDFSEMGINLRVLLLAKHLEHLGTTCMSRFDINISDFDVLGTLRRSGAPYALSAGALAKSVMLSSGAMTNRIDRLESRGLVTRQSDPSDRRGVLVQLTESGKELTERALAEKQSKGGRSISVFDKEERKTLESLLRRFLQHVEQLDY